MNRYRQKEKTRKLIQQKALELFRSQGYQKTSVLQITESAGVAKGTFFNYFRTKEEVLFSISEQQIQLVEAKFANLSSVNSFLEKLHILLETLAKISEELGREVIKSFFHLATISPNIAERAEFQLFTKRLVSLFESGQSAGELRNNLPASVLASAFLQLYVGVLHYWCITPSAPSLSVLLNKSFSIFFSGIKKEN